MSRAGSWSVIRRQRPADFAKMKRDASSNRFEWRSGERIDGPLRRRPDDALADLNSARQASWLAREWLARIEREPRPPAGIVDRRLLAAKLALDDLTEQERQAAVRAMETI